MEDNKEYFKFKCKPKCNTNHPKPVDDGYPNYSAHFSPAFLSCGYVHPGGYFIIPESLVWSNEANKIRLAFDKIGSIFYSTVNWKYSIDEDFILYYIAEHATEEFDVIENTLRGWIGMQSKYKKYLLEITAAYREEFKKMETSLVEFTHLKEIFTKCLDNQDDKETLKILSEVNGLTALELKEIDKIINTMYSHKAVDGVHSVFNDVDMDGEDYTCMSCGQSFSIAINLSSIWTSAHKTFSVCSCDCADTIIETYKREKTNKIERIFKSQITHLNDIIDRQKRDIRSLAKEFLRNPFVCPLCDKFKNPKLSLLDIVYYGAKEREIGEFDDVYPVASMLYRLINSRSDLPFDITNASCTGCGHEKVVVRERIIAPIKNLLLPIWDAFDFVITISARLIIYSFKACSVMAIVGFICYILLLIWS